MKNKLPITRISKFWSQSDFDLNVQIGQEYLHGDLGMKLVLFRVDRQNTSTDEVYAEVGKDEIKFLPPVEFFGLVKIEEPKNNSYNKGVNRYQEPGNMTISVYIDHLQSLGVDINYGDYIGYPESEERIRYYTVTNNGKVTSDNKHNMFGYKPFYRTITCVPAQESEFRGI